MPPDQPVTASEDTREFQSSKKLKSSGQPPSPPNIAQTAKSVRQEGQDGGFTPALQPKVREVAGDVRRVTGQVPRAEPPPTNHARSSGSSRQDSSSRRPRRNGPQRPENGDSSDSESDEFERNRKPEDGKAAVKKPARRPFLIGTPESSGVNTNALEEEMERISTLRIKRHLEEMWPAVQHQRQLNRDCARAKKKALVLRKIRTEQQSNVYHCKEWASDLQQFVSRLDLQHDSYLDEALFNTLYAKSDGGTADSHGLTVSHKRMAMEYVEIEFLLRSGCLNGTMLSYRAEPTIEAQLVSDIRNMANFPRRPSSSQPVVSSLASQALVDSYVDQIVHVLDDLASRLDNLPRLCKLILESHSDSDNADEKLNEYIDWMFSGAPDGEFERCCLLVKEFHDFRVNNLPSLDNKPEQVFFLQRDDMYLVSFKGGFATSIKRLPRADIHSLGWFSSGIPGLGAEFWRLEYDPEWDSVFIVDVDEEILGIWVHPVKLLLWDRSMDGLLDDWAPPNNGSL